MWPFQLITVAIVTYCSYWLTVARYWLEQPCARMVHYHFSKRKHRPMGEDWLVMLDWWRIYKESIEMLSHVQLPSFFFNLSGTKEIMFFLLQDAFFILFPGSIALKFFCIFAGCSKENQYTIGAFSMQWSFTLKNQPHDFSFIKIGHSL